jgi:hypothetical protein
MGAAMKLYELADALEQVNDALVDAGGELTDELEQQLDAMSEAFADKLDRIAALIAMDDRLAGMASEEAKRLTALAKSRKTAAESLRRYTKRCMEQAGRTQVDTPRFNITVRETPKPSLVWVGGVLPTRFRRTTVELNKDAAHRELKEKGKLPKGFAITYSTFLNIR